MAIPSFGRCIFGGTLRLFKRFPPDGHGADGGAAGADHPPGQIANPNLAVIGKTILHLDQNQARAPRMA
jgi:hypothetical protein